MKQSLQPKNSVMPACLLLVLAATASGLVFADPPPTVNIRGQLLDAQGHALSGVRDFSVQFFNAMTDGAALGEAITGSTEVSLEGLFNIPVVLPPQALTAPEVWYEMAISSSATPGPIGASDVFPSRVKLESVPFALESAEAAHVDVSAIGAGTVLDGEFDFLSGLTANIQDQLDTKANSADVYTKTEVDDLQTAQDTLQTAQDEAIAGKVSKAGDTMTGALTVNDSYVGIGEFVPPVPTSEKLYNNGGILWWSGNPVYQYPWLVVTDDTSLEPNRGYISDSSDQLTLTLPPSYSLNVGNTVRVSALGAQGWKIAQNASQSILVWTLEIPNSSGTWLQRESNQNWQGIASSADGEKLAACISGGYVYVSADGGMTWTQRANMMGWMGIASSENGETLLGVASSAPLYVSTDSGVTWTTHGSSLFWTGAAASADGTKLFATAGFAGGAYVGGVYVSTDQGETWTARGASNLSWRDVACSADGTKVVACATNNGYIYTSTDSGTTWTPRDSQRFWDAVASSADGTKLVACVYSGAIYTSTDSGETWTSRTANNSWEDVASSADGTKLAAVGPAGVITSSDSGETWSDSLLSGSLRSVVASADFTRLAACAYGGRIHTYSETLLQTTPGTSGWLSGGRNAAVELLYLGNDLFVPVSHEGAMGAF